MPIARVNGIRVNYDDTGSGPPVILVMGTGGRGRGWHLHQVPGLVAAGYRVITFDNRGVSPTDECPDGFTIDDLVADTAGLIEHLELRGAGLVGVSMGAQVIAELMVARPELVGRAVLMATRGRSDTARTAFGLAERELFDSGVVLPPRFDAMVRALRNLSPRTLDDDAAMRDWLEVFSLWPEARSTGVRAQLDLDLFDSRLDAYRVIRAPTLVIGFGDDLTLPPHLGREVADAIPGARFALIDGCGHYGYLERPEEVNAMIVDFLRSEA